MTVSRVINNHKYVSKAMREKVNAVIAELNYSPNLSARSLSASVRIGVLYSNPNSSNLGDFLMGAFRQGGASGCQLLVEPAVIDGGDNNGVEKLLAGGVEGIILPPPLCDSAAVLDMLKTEGVFALGFATAAPRADVSAVSVDDFRGACMMTQYLIDLGHTDIGFVRGDPKHSPSARREEGFRATMADAGLSIRADRIAEGHFTYRSGLDAARALLDRPDRPTAIFASNDDMAASVSAVAHGLGMKLPGDLSIGGFDDAPVASTVWPELTTIRQPIPDMAASAVAILCDQIRRARAGQDVPIQHHMAEVTLVERGSTAPPRR